MAYNGALVHPKIQNKVKKMKKTHRECIKIGEIASEGRRRLIDDE
jgi:hypothetical protein